MDQNCDDCKKLIKAGQDYYCWTVSLETMQGNTIHVKSSEAIKVLCTDCGQKEHKKATQELVAPLN